MPKEVLPVHDAANTFTHAMTRGGYSVTNKSRDSRFLNRRRLLQAAVAGSATVALGQAASAAAAPSPGKGFHFSRTPAYQSDAPISVLVPSFASIGDGFMRDQAEAFTSETGIGVDIQFLPFEKAMDRQTTLVAAQSGEVDVFGTHYAQIGKFGAGMVPLNDLAAASDVKAEDYVANSFDYLSVDGKLLAIPFTFDLRTLFYRTDLFEAAGIEAPRNVGRVHRCRDQGQQPARRLWLHGSRQG